MAYSCPVSQFPFALGADAVGRQLPLLGVEAGAAVGQQHLLGEGALLRRIAQGGNIPNLIFYGPSGVGKTTAARIIAAAAGKKLEKLNGTTASTGGLNSKTVLRLRMAP